MEENRIESQREKQRIKRIELVVELDMKPSPDQEA